MLWCLSVSRRVLVIDEDGIECRYLTRKPRRVAWSEVQRSEIMRWINRRPYQLLVFGESPDKPLLDIALKLYDIADVDYLLNLEGLKIRNYRA